MSLWDRTLNALGVRKSTGDVKLEDGRLVLRELARAKALPQEPKEPGPARMTECARCGGRMREIVFTTAGGGEQLEVWREYPLAVDGWVCAGCGNAVMPRHISLEESLEFGRRGAEHAGGGNFDDAEFWFRRIIGSWPNYPPGYADLGQLFMARSDAAKSADDKHRYRRDAAAWLRRAIDGDPERKLLPVRVTFARALALNGSEAEALAMLAALGQDAGLSESVRTEADQLAKDIGAGKALFARAVELAKDTVLEPPGKVLTAHARSALERARGLLRDAREREQNFATCWYLGKVELRLGDTKSAAIHLEEAHSLNPDQPDGCRELCLAYLELDRVQDALPMAQHALGLRPDDASLRSNLALVHLFIGDVNRALTEVRAALASEPNDKITAALARMIEDVSAGRRKRPRSMAEAKGRKR
ncbi:MAG TPA: tetratricopeptide repeat protein [Polyangiaceae bacterium]|jgi:tetratricopeptide (TPR) repeat protein